MSDVVHDLSPESLARANEANLAEGFAGYTRAYGGEVVDEPDLLWCATGFGSTGWNRVPRANLSPESVDERIEWVKSRARALNVPFGWDVGPSMRPLDLGEHLQRHGLTHGEDEPAMGVALAHLPSALPELEGVTIERVRDRATMELWARASCAGFEMPDSIAEPLVAASSRDDLGDDAGRAYYLAWLHGEPVATSALAPQAGVAGIFAVSTVTASRRRGIGAAVTLAALLDGRDRGFHIGVLQASEMGYSVYASLGFTEQFRYHVYTWRPE